MQRTLVLIKPDAVEEDNWLSIIQLYQQYTLKIQRTQILAPMNRHFAIQLYDEHRGKNFYDELISFMTSGVTIALEIVGDNVVALVRAINGATKPSEATEGTIRNLYGSKGPANAVHGSASPAAAERELALIFGPTY